MDSVFAVLLYCDVPQVILMVVIHIICVLTVCMYCITYIYVGKYIMEPWFIEAMLCVIARKGVCFRLDLLLRGLCLA